MHIPDGFIDIPTSAAFGTLALAGTAIALKKAKTEVDDRTAPMAGLTAVFIFAVQMLNFPVAAGTSGHLLGGALAMVLVGPYAASLAITVVLGVQALLFADGGLTALGLNVFNLSVIAVLVSFLVFKLMVKLLPKTKSAIPLAAGIAAFVSVPISASALKPKKCVIFQRENNSVELGINDISWQDFIKKFSFGIFFFYSSKSSRGSK